MINMSDQVAPDTFTYTLAGREMTLYTTSNGQRLMMERHINRLRNKLSNAGGAEADPKEWLKLLQELEHFTWDVVETKFIDPSDLAFVETQILAGKVQIEDAYVILANGVRPKPAVADDADPAPVKRVKQPAKKTAKKAASPRSGTRRVTR